MSDVLLDGDLIVYRSAASAQEEWDGEAISDPRRVISTAQHLIDTWSRKARGSKKPILCFSDDKGGNFRKTLNPDYKAQRKAEKPLHYWEVVEHFKEEYKCVFWPELEADDVMGILAGHPKLDNPVMVTIDKDLLTVPGRLLNPKSMKRPVVIKERQADWQWMFQTLIGDPIDGYKGAFRIGKVKAQKALAEGRRLSEWWELVVQTFIGQGQTAEDALLNARMARILRWDDYDIKTQEVTIWSPKS